MASYLCQCSSCAIPFFFFFFFLAAVLTSAGLQVNDPTPILPSASAQRRRRQQQQQQQLLVPSDSLALRAIHGSLHDTFTNRTPSSLFFFASSWDFSRDPCSFDGVLCDSVSGHVRVVALNLGIATGGSAGLHGRLPPELGYLTALVQLTLAPGKVSGPIPAPALSKLKNLQNLGLSHNLLTGEIPSTLGGLRNLQVLDLSFNRLSGAVPAQLSEIPTLITLRLAHNRLTGRLPASFERAPKLNHVDLKRNSIEGPLPLFPSSVTYLDLSRNRLAGLLSPAIGRLEWLAYLDLSDNRLTGGLPKALLAAPLEALILRHNALSGPVSPPGPVNIPTVDLAFNELSGPISPFLAPARNLYLNHNRFTGPVPEEIVEQVEVGSMHTLFLQHNFLTGFPLGGGRRGTGTSLPLSAAVCIQYNCMAPPIESPCPHSGGMLAIRPSSECRNT